MKNYPLLLLALSGAFGFSDLLAVPPSYIQTENFIPAKEKAAAERTLPVYIKETLKLKLNKASALMRLTTGAVAFRNYHLKYNQSFFIEPKRLFIPADDQRKLSHRRQL